MGKEMEAMLLQIQADMRGSRAETRAEMQKLTDNMISRFDRVEGTMCGLRSDIAGVRQELSVVKKDMSERIAATEKTCDELHELIKNAKAEAKAEALSELHAVEAKRPNVIIFGIPEPSGDASLRDQDIKAVDDIIESLTGNKKPFDLRFRIGKKQAKPRPILIRMLDLKDKEEILGKGYKLKDHPQWKDIYIKEDLTRSQREQVGQLNEKLAAEATSKNAGLKNEDWRWVVRGRGMQRHLAKSKNKE